MILFLISDRNFTRDLISKMLLLSEGFRIRLSNFIELNFITFQKALS